MGASRSGSLQSVIVPVAMAMVACLGAGPVRAEEVAIFAAASLTDAFRDLGELLRSRGAGRTAFSFAGTSELRVQIENGAPADVFASASAEEMEKAKIAGIIDGEPVPFARNRLVVILPRDNPGKIRSLADLGRTGIKFLTTHPSVPVGRYTLAMLEKMGKDPAYGPAYRDAVKNNTVSLETNVRQVSGKVILGEVDAGVVYVSDVTASASARLLTIEVPPEFNVVAAYPVAVVASSKRKDLARRFIALILSPEGQAILQKHRFIPLSER